jgi:hypothetical protein
VERLDWPGDFDILAPAEFSPEVFLYLAPKV